jgi:hypothetical protein
MSLKRIAAAPGLTSAYYNGIFTAGVRLRF